MLRHHREGVKMVYSHPEILSAVDVSLGVEAQALHWRLLDRGWSVWGKG